MKNAQLGSANNRVKNIYRKKYFFYPITKKMPDRYQPVEHFNFSCFYQ